MKLTLLAILFLAFAIPSSAQEYQKVKYTVVVRGSQYGEYTMSNWIEEKDISAFFSLVGIDQKKIDERLQTWKDNEEYAKQHPAPYTEPTKEDYINLYNERIDEAQNYLDKYSTLADKTELEAIKADLESKVSAINTTISTKTAEVIK